MKLHRIFAACTLALAPLLPASATIMTWDAILNGTSEAVPNASPGIGAALVTIDDILNTMRVQVEFSGLTSGVTASHIHCCTTTVNTGTAIVATVTPTFTGFPSGVTSGTYDHTFDLLDVSSYNSAFITANGGTAATAEAALLAGLGSFLTGSNAYLNIHTTNFPGGEIRGFLERCNMPDPETKTFLPCVSVASAPEPPVNTLIFMALACIAGLAYSRLKEA